MALGNGKPRPEDAPFFGELTVDLTLSEPEYRLPVDQEQISSMEALHEEIYFNTLHFFDVMGRFTRGAGLAYPGRVIPVDAPEGRRQGRAREDYGHRLRRGAAVGGRRVHRAQRPDAARRGSTSRRSPSIVRRRWPPRVRDGQDGIERLDLRLKVDTEKDERDALVKRTAEDRVDRTMLSAEQVTRRRSRTSAGCARPALYRDALAYHDLGSVRVTVGWEHESKPGTEVVATLEPNGAPAPFPDIKTLLPAGRRARRRANRSCSGTRRFRRPRRTAILAKMSTFKEATVYKVGESYLGKDVWAMDLMPPIEASHWSQAKQTTLKPTIVYSARQHANEVSSTSHVLSMAELLLTDPAYRDKLNKVNVVIHPITNADGAQLAYDLQKINPTYMLHAGYLGSLGVDVTAAQWDPDPMYPESGIRPKIWRTWLPDIFLNPHGYPSHEWVQIFSEYAAVGARRARSRRATTGRCAAGGCPGSRWLDDARYPRHKDEQMKLLEMITELREAGAGHRRAQRARLRSLQALQLRLRSEELQARFHQRRADLQVDQGRARQPAEPATS